jgi:hypothetical protein
MGSRYIETRMSIDDAGEAVTEFLLLMDRVHDMIRADHDPLAAVLLLHDARALLRGAEAALRDADSRDRIRLRGALPHLRWRLAQLEHASKAAAAGEVGAERARPLRNYAHGADSK